MPDPSDDPLSAFAELFRNAQASDVLVVDAPSEKHKQETFVESVARGLARTPRELDCRYLYDAKGSELFEAITEQPEYYPTRTEAAILAQHADTIRDLTGPATLVELGSGYSVKTEHLLRAYSRDGVWPDYIPVDVSGSALDAAGESIATSFPDVNFTGIRGTYASAFSIAEQLSPLMMVFLGSTLGNFPPAQHDAFWRSVGTALPAGDHFLLGVDLVKDPAVLEAAYNDAAGMTAQFTVNYFARMNSELGTSLDVDKIEHIARWNDELDQIEIWARFHTRQEIASASLDRRFVVEAGEEVLVEISRKFRPERLEESLGRFGFRVRKIFHDDKRWFGLALLQRDES